MTLLAPSLLVARLLVPGALACGPFFDSLAFTTDHTPDPDLAAFAAGKVGIVSPRWYDTYQVAAWRALHGAPLTEAERTEVVAAWARPEDGVSDALSVWQKARTAWPEPPNVFPWATGADYESWPNCGADALVTAARTAESRTATWGATSPWMKDWVAAQDAVFVGCSDLEAPEPAPAPPGAPELLRQDRAYQHAAWAFYTRRYAEAGAEFLALKKDPTSPWAPWSTYLAARAALRAWSVEGEPREPADGLLRAVTGPLAASARALLDFGVRTPAAPWRDGLATRLSAPGGVARQTVVDFTIAMDTSRWEAVGKNRWDGLSYRELAPGQEVELVDWIATFRVPEEAPPDADRAAYTHAVQRWEATHDEAWLVAALSRVTQPSPDLLAAAARVPADHAAWPTVTFVRARSLEVGAPADARALYDTLLASPLPPASRNLVERRRTPLATDLHDWLTHALRLPVAFGTDEAGGPGGPVPAELLHPTLEGDGARVLAMGLPTNLLVTAASEPAASSIAADLWSSIWVRSIVLGDDATLLLACDHVALPVAEVKAAADPATRRFLAAVVALRNPGVRYAPRAGAPRAEKVDVIDDFRDNWWSYLSAGPGSGDTSAPGSLAPAFLTADERAQATREATAAVAAGGGDKAFGDIVLSYAAAHPDDPALPDALALVVHATRFVPSPDHATSKAAFTLLHSRWPTSAAAKRTKYWY